MSIRLWKVTLCVYCIHDPKEGMCENYSEIGSIKEDRPCKLKVSNSKANMIKCNNLVQSTIIQNGGSMTRPDIVKKTNLKTNTVYNTLKRLEHIGLIRRDTIPRDKVGRPKTLWTTSSRREAL